MHIKMLFMAMLLSLTAGLQSQSYNFSVTNGTYTNLVGSTSLNNGFTWDDPSYTVPIGFNFQFFNTSMDYIYIDYGLGAFLTADTSETGIYALLTPFGADIIDRAYDTNTGEISTGALSNISYKTEGAVGSRILKIEWKNVGFYGEASIDNISTDFTNFQLWLYEGTNAVEMHYGPSLYGQYALDFEDQSGPLVVLFEAFDFDNEEIEGEGLALSGSGASPLMETVSSVDFVPFLSTAPLNGTVYVFSSTASGTKETEHIPTAGISISPNPATDQLTVVMDGEQSEIRMTRIIDINGKVIRSFAGNRNSIPVADLLPGSYFIQVSTVAGGMATRGFIKE